MAGRGEGEPILYDLLEISEYFYPDGQILETDDVLEGETSAPPKVCITDLVILALSLSLSLSLCIRSSLPSPRSPLLVDTVYTLHLSSASLCSGYSGLHRSNLCLRWQSLPFRPHLGIGCT
eukprot:TRINITY_DN1566_c0_g1_i1.p1 TRINITY_DN1566_c0_g1~~TRINITY_DN1566_c0_g1_i1.p1  ORF type:complete len:121 (-),score=10.45 TRINITY_DN1566_c0_g1_i1:54-416(-)